MNINSLPTQTQRAERHFAEYFSGTRILNSEPSQRLLRAPPPLHWCVVSCPPRRDSDEIILQCLWPPICGRSPYKERTQAIQQQKQQPGFLYLGSMPHTQMHTHAHTLGLGLQHVCVDWFIRKGSKQKLQKEII